MSSAAAGTSAAPAALAIETRGLTREFDGLVAVDHVDLAVASGTIFGLLGPNGAGKSTTIKILITLLPPSAGIARVAGLDVVRDAAAVRRRIGYVPQLLSADGALTGRENLVLSARLYGLSRALRDERIAEALSFMGLEDAGDTLVRQYSGGMVRRLELAQAMLHLPEVLFLDEPTIGLDPLARRAVWDRLLESRRRFAMTVMLTTHDMEEAEVLCNALAIMHAGRIAVQGPPAELRAHVGKSATLEDVFARAVAGAPDEGGSYRDIRSTRRTATRLG